MADPGFNYLGTLDDVVERYPWRFALNKRRLEYSLVTQLINGRPVLLNDGYLLQNSLALEAVRDEQSLLWEMIRKGYVRILARGGNRYQLHELPKHVRGVPTIERLSSSDEWPDFEKKIARLDTILRADNYLLPWPSFDAGSGFRELARHLSNNGSTPWSLGLGRGVRKPVWSSFLSEFLDRMDTDTRGARSFWEQLARRYADDPTRAREPEAFVRALMNLANEMYHYNFGIMLASEHDVPVSVETQSSAAFDDLIVQHNVLISEIPKMPRLRVPRAILSVPPSKLVQILDTGREVGKARQRWLTECAAYEAGADRQASQLNDAAKDYSSKLATFVGHDVKYDESEGFIKYVLGSGASKVRDGLGGFVGSGVASYLDAQTGIPMFSSTAGFIAGYGLSKLQSWGIGIVTKKYKVELLKQQVLPPKLIQESARAVSHIKFRRFPSSLVIGRSYALEISSKMKRFAE